MDDIDTPVKALAVSHAAALLDKMMHTDPATALEQEHIPMLKAWATGKNFTLQPTSQVYGGLNAPAINISNMNIEEVTQQLTLLEKQMKALESRLPKPHTTTTSHRSYGGGAPGSIQMQLTMQDEYTARNDNDGKSTVVHAHDFYALVQVVSEQGKKLEEASQEILLLRDNQTGTSYQQQVQNSRKSHMHTPII